MIINVNQIGHQITTVHRIKTNKTIVPIEEMTTIKKVMDIKQRSMDNKEVIIFVVLHITDILLMGII